MKDGCSARKGRRASCGPRASCLRARTLPLKELRLSVADTNHAARALFTSEGFHFLPYELGTYHRGQLALRMGLTL